MSCQTEQDVESLDKLRSPAICILAGAVLGVAVWESEAPAIAGAGHSFEPGSSRDANSQSSQPRDSAIAGGISRYALWSGRRSAIPATSARTDLTHCDTGGVRLVACSVQTSDVAPALRPGVGARFGFAAAGASFRFALRVETAQFLGPGYGIDAFTAVNGNSNRETQ